MRQVKKETEKERQVVSPSVSVNFNSFFKREISNSRKVVNTIVKQKDASSANSLKTVFFAYIHKDT